MQNARNIGGVSFNGGADINLPGVNAAGNQNTTGNAGSATQVYVTETSANNNYPVAFYNASVTQNSGNMDMYKDDNAFWWNPGQHSLSVPAITSNTFGNSGQNAYGNRTVSTSGPSGGSDGDIWYKY